VNFNGLHGIISQEMKPFITTAVKASDRTDQEHTDERGLLNALQFGSRARHSMTLQCIGLADHVTLDFNSNICMAAVFFDIKKSL
jgi:hypothetical protein